MRYVASAVLAFWVIGADAAEQADIFESKLAADTEFVVAVDNVSVSCAAWQATQLGKLLQGELFVPVRQAAAKQGVPTLLYLRPCFGFDWEDLSAYAGPAAVAVVPIGDGKVGFAWVFPAAKLATDKLFAAGRAYFRDRGYEETAETVDEVKLTVFKPSSAERDSYHPVYLVSPAVSVVATHRDAAVAIWKQFSDQAKTSLGTEKDFSDLMSGPSSGASDQSLRCWLRPLALWEVIQGRQAKKGRHDWLAIAERQGGKAIRAMGGRIEFPKSGSTDLDIRGRVLVTQPLTKAAKLLDFTAAARLPLPVWLDDQVASVSVWGCNVPEAVTAFGCLFDEMNEPGPTGQGVFQDMLAGLRDDPEGPQVDLVRDLFAHLGPGALEATDCRGHDAKDKNQKPRRTQLVLECRNAAAVTKTFRRFYKDDKDVHESTIDKGTLWTIAEGRSLLFEEGESEESSESEGAKEGGKGSSKSVAKVRAILVSDKVVVFATDPEVLTNHLWARADSGLAESAVYKAVSTWQQAVEIRGDRDLGFLQLGLWLEPSYDAVRGRVASDDWTTSLLRLLFTGSHEPSAKVPVDELPAFAKVAPSLPAMGSVRGKDAAGWDIRISTLQSSPKKP